MSTWRVRQVELRQILKTAPRSNHLFHAPPESFNQRLLLDSRVVGFEDGVY